MLIKATEVLRKLTITESQAIDSINGRNYHYWDERPPKVGSKEDRKILAGILLSLGYTRPMVHWLIFYILTAMYSGLRKETFASLRRDFTLVLCIDSVGFHNLAKLLRRVTL